MKTTPSQLLTVPGTIPSPVAKPTKVSFKDRIKNLQHDSSSKNDKEKKDVNEMKEHLLPSTSAKSSKPSTSFKDKIKSLSHVPLGHSSSHTIKDETQIKPWSKLKVLSHVPTGNSPIPSPKEEPAPHIKPWAKFKSFAHIPKETPQPKVEPLKPWSKLKLATVNIGGSYSSLNNSIKDDSPTGSQPVKISRTLEISDDINLNQSTDKIKSIKKLKPEQVSVSDSEIKSIEPFHKISKIKLKHKTLMKQREPKSYRSVDDLSPEYGGLPFVKKLKILNERQKLAELESVIQTRSFSLDCTDSGNSTDLMEPLTRSHSEASGMARPKNIIPVEPINIPQCLSPLSPESNETLERRQLKSILKKLSEDKLQKQLTKDGCEQQERKGLLREPTLEGYVARHSKFMKSVTFNNTLSSPPNSANLCEMIEERSLFPLLSAQPNNTMLTSQIDTENLADSTNRLQELDIKEISLIDSDTNSKNFISSMATQKKLLKGKYLHFLLFSLYSPNIFKFFYFHV